MQPIFKSTGTYLGFIANGFLFSRDGEYMGWVEGTHVWDALGRFRGQVWNAKYIITNRFAVSPVPRPPRPAPTTPALPNPQANLAAIPLPTGWVDSF
jgi:hypothetical protein